MILHHICICSNSWNGRISTFSQRRHDWGAKPLKKVYIVLCSWLALWNFGDRNSGSISCIRIRIIQQKNENTGPILHQRRWWNTFPARTFFRRKLSSTHGTWMQVCKTQTFILCRFINVRYYIYILSYLCCKLGLVLENLPFEKKTT